MQAPGSRAVSRRVDLGQGNMVWNVEYCDNRAMNGGLEPKEGVEDGEAKGNFKKRKGRYQDIGEICWNLLQREP